MRQTRPRLTILVVQQDAFERERMAELLSKGSVTVVSARDGREGLDKLRDHEPDLLVTDITLPKIDGPDFIRMARQEREDLKVVAAFGPYSPKALVRAVESGVDAFLRLPVDGGKLRSAVAECARRIAMERRMARADYSLRQLLDFFPGPAILVDGLEVGYMNRPLAQYLGYGDFEAMTTVDVGLEDFVVRVGEEPYDGHPTNWLTAIMDDPLDRDHVVHIENPRHPRSRPNAFAVTYNRFPGSELKLFTFQDVSGLEDERIHLEDEAATDPLTRALNRRSFLILLDQAAASRRPFSLIMFDIDHFKSVNDTFGHDAGDAVLREIAALVRDNVRENDTLARWGGEEFMVLSLRTGPDRARRVAERLRSAVAGHAFTNVPRPVTASFGVAIHIPGETGEALAKRADQALYQAKETGRNKVVTG